MKKIDSIFWEKLLNTEFIFENKCYETCSSFCCKWKTPDIPLRFQVTGGTLFYLPKEYEYMTSIGVSLRNPVKSIGINVNDKRIETIYQHCNDDNNCNILFKRPLSCKLYPFLPIYDLDTDRIIDVEYFSVYDINADYINYRTPCYVKDYKEKYLQLWNSDNEQSKILRDPYIMFYLSVANVVRKNYVYNLKKTLLNKEDNKTFWKKWEMLYLDKKLIDINVIHEEILILLNYFTKEYDLNL